MESGHTTVLLQETVDAVEPQEGRVIVDCTLGGGGHTRALLERGATVFGLDRDHETLAQTSERLRDFGDRFRGVHAAFGNLQAVLIDAGTPKVDGIIADLGMSSIQLDSAERGFSFMRDGPLDMRMDTSDGETARDLLRTKNTQELIQIFREFGEERFAVRIAERIKAALGPQTLRTTSELAELVSKAIPGKARAHLRVHPATKVFQALRIAVNDELGQLHRLLDVIPDTLKPGGRCGIISFHSLEDRAVKRAFRDFAWSSSLPPDLAKQAGERVTPLCKLVTRKPINPSDDEIAANPRARSAHLRVCEKL